MGNYPLTSEQDSKTSPINIKELKFTGAINFNSEWELADTYFPDNIHANDIHKKITYEIAHNATLHRYQKFSESPYCAYYLDHKSISAQQSMKYAYCYYYLFGLVNLWKKEITILIYRTGHNLDEFQNQDPTIWDFDARRFTEFQDKVKTQLLPLVKSEFDDTLTYLLTQIADLNISANQSEANKQMLFQTITRIFDK